MRWLYGNAWERYPIEDGQTWTAGESAMTVQDIRDPLPAHMKRIELLYSDPPWDQSLCNGFLTKAEKGRKVTSFQEFLNAYFAAVDFIDPAVAYIEVGAKHLADLQAMMSQRWKSVQTWKITYYRKLPCYLVRGARIGTTAYFTDMDDEHTPEAAIRAESLAVVGDLCVGMGATPVAAHKLGKAFCGTELNKRRMANAIDRVAKLGVDYKPA